MAKKRPRTPKASRPKAADMPAIGYAELLGQIKERIQAARLRATIAVNRELVLLYWQIGREILARQGREGWGAKVIDRLADDRRCSFPEMTGLSPRNLKYMRAFGEAWPEEELVQGPLAQITWYHNLARLEKVEARPQRLWYAHKAIEHGWSRNVLVHWIESDLFARQGKAVTNFPRSLPPGRSDLAGELLKDPYYFEFLTLSHDAEERALQKGLLEHIHRFLIEVGEEDFFLDLLFYHLKLRCYVVIELKTTAFRPEYAGKMNFYLSAVDDLLRHPDDQPSIGIILCKAKNRVVAEYALRDVAKPMGVASYITRLVESLPPELRESLPSPGALEAELREDTGE